MPAQTQRTTTPERESTVDPSLESGSERSEEGHERNAPGVGARAGWDYASLKDLLDNRPDEATGEQLEAIVARIARWNGGDKATLLGDAATMTKLFNKLSSSQATMALNYLQPDLVTAVKWQLVAGAIDIGAWSRLVSGRTSEECLQAVLDNNTVTILRNMGGATALEMFPNLTLDPERIQRALAEQSKFLPWIIATDGVARALEMAGRLAEFEADQQLRDAMMTTGLYDFTLALMPSPCTDDRECRRLYNWLMSTTDATEAKKLFQARFGTELADYEGQVDDPTTVEDESKPAASWDRDSIVRLWQICGRLPANAVETAKRMLRESESGNASGWANARGEIGMSWGNDQIGNNEVGAYTEDDDTMRGLNIFDACIRHEIGHTVGADGGFDSDGGFVFTTHDWQEHADFEALVDLFAGKYPLDGSIDATIQGRILGAFKQVTSWNKAAVDERLKTWADHYTQPDIETEGKASDLYGFITGRMTGGPWKSPVDIDGRSYHVDYSPRGDWVSCPMGLYGKKVSTYAMRSPAEWFAEGYATFYADADTPNTEVGTLLKGRDPALYSDIMDKVHENSIWNLFQRTGQEMSHDTMGV